METDKKTTTENSPTILNKIGLPAVETTQKQEMTLKKVQATNNLTNLEYGKLYSSINTEGKTPTDGDDLANITNDNFEKARLLFQGIIAAIDNIDANGSTLSQELQQLKTYLEQQLESIDSVFADIDFNFTNLSRNLQAADTAITKNLKDHIEAPLQHFYILERGETMDNKKSPGIYLDTINMQNIYSVYIQQNKLPLPTMVYQVKISPDFSAMWKRRISIAGTVWTEWDKITGNEQVETTIQPPRLETIAYTKGNDSYQKPLMISHNWKLTQKQIEKYNPRIVIMRKKRTGTRKNTEGTLAIKRKNKWAETSGFRMTQPVKVPYIVSPSPVWDSFAMNFTLNGQRYTPKSNQAGRYLDIDWLVKHFLVTDETGENIRFVCSKKWLNKEDYEGKSIKAMFGICIRITNPDFNPNGTAPNGGMEVYKNQQQFLYGQITRLLFCVTKIGDNTIPVTANNINCTISVLD